MAHAHLLTGAHEKTHPGHARRVEVAGSQVEVVETPSTVWLLDHHACRFARVTPEQAATVSPYALEWRRCSRIEFDATTSTHAIYLDDDGRRVIRFR